MVGGNCFISHFSRNVNWGPKTFINVLPSYGASEQLGETEPTFFRLQLECSFYYIPKWIQRWGLPLHDRTVISSTTWCLDWMTSLISRIWGAVGPRLHVTKLRLSQESKEFTSSWTWRRSSGPMGCLAFTPIDYGPCDGLNCVYPKDILIS